LLGEILVHKAGDNLLGEIPVHTAGDTICWVRYLFIERETKFAG